MYKVCVCVCIYIYIYIYIYMYIIYFPPVIIHFSPFINDLKITLKVLLKQKSNHFTVQSLPHHPFKATTW